MKETLGHLLTVASEEDVTSGVETVDEKYSFADKRWLQLKAMCEERTTTMIDIKDLFFSFEEHIGLVENELDRIEGSFKTKVAVGTDPKKINEEINKVEVCWKVLSFAPLYIYFLYFAQLLVSFP